MKLHLSHVTLVVSNQAEAFSFYTEKLGFEKRSDTPMSPTTRWLTVGLPGDTTEFVLQPPDWFEGEEREKKAALVGQTPSPVLAVDDCHALYEAWQAKGVRFLAPPETTPWGIQALAFDLDGNMLVIVQS